jgi:hypothetical protein
MIFVVCTLGFILAALICYGFGRLWRRQQNRRRLPDIEKPSGYSTSDTTLSLGGRQINTARVAVAKRDEITRVRVEKYTRRAGQTSWQVMTENTPLCPEDYDEPLEERFWRIVVRNNRGTALPDELVILTETLGEGLVLRPGSVKCRINGTAEFVLDDRMAEPWLIEGKGLSMKAACSTVHIPNYKGGIPAQGSLAVEFATIITNGQVEQGYAGELVDAPPDLIDKANEEKARLAAEAEVARKAAAVAEAARQVAARKATEKTAKVKEATRKKAETAAKKVKAAESHKQSSPQTEEGEEDEENGGGTAPQSQRRSAKRSGSKSTGGGNVANLVKRPPR